MNNITSFSIRLDIPNTDLLSSDISHIVQKSLTNIISSDNINNIEIDVFDITEQNESE